MPAYGKIALVSTRFHPSDVAFAIGWSRRAPGIDGWRVLLDREEETEQVSVIPPGSKEVVFVITRDGTKAVIERLNGQSRQLVGEFTNLRLAVQALCPLQEEHLQEINEELELAFPRPRGGR
jgi:hypothetical protein